MNSQKLTVIALCLPNGKWSTGKRANGGRTQVITTKGLGTCPIAQVWGTSSYPADITGKALAEIINALPEIIEKLRQLETLQEKHS